MKIGKVSESVLKRSVLKQIKENQTQEMVSGAFVGADCAIFAFKEENSRVMTCVQETALEQAADMERVLHKAANNLACTGAVPTAVLVSLLLPENTEETAIKEWMGTAQKTCEALSMVIAGGQTNVSADVVKPHVSVTGIGKTSAEFTVQPGSAVPGQDIVVSKWIGLEGTARLAAAGAEKLASRYPLHLIEEAASFGKYISVLPEAEAAVKAGVSAMHDVSEGGIFRALWELAESAGTGLCVDLKKLPVRQETIEVCEFFGLNPYELLGGGSLLMAADDGEGLVQALEQQHIPAKVVGKLTDNHDRIVINEDETRFLERPRTDEIYKIKF